MATVAEMVVRLYAETGDFTKKISGASNELTKFGSGTVKLSQGIATGLMAGAVALGAFGGASIKMASDMEQTEIAFATLLGDSQKAQKFLGELSDFASKTPFEMPGLQKSARQLLAFGFQSEEIIPMMTKIGDAIGALGGGEEEINRVVGALGQMKAKGKTSREELLQIAELGIPVFDILQKKFGMTGAELDTAITKGAIGAQQAIDALTTGMGEKFAGAMQKQSETMNGLWSTILDNARQITIQIGKELIAGLNLKAIVKNVGDLVSAFASLSKQMGTVPALLEMIPPEAQFVIVTLAGAIAGSLVPAIISFGTKLKTVLIPQLWATLAPMLPWIALGAVIAGTAYLIIKNWSAISKFFVDLWGNILSITKNTLNGIKNYIINSWSSISQTTENIWSNIINFFTTKIPSMINSVITWFSNLVTQITTFMRSLPSIIIYYIGFAIGSMVRLVINGVISTINWFQQLPTRIATFFINLYTSTVQTFNLLRTYLVNTSISIFNGIVNWFQQLPNRIATFFVILQASIIQKYNSIKNYLINASISIFNGIVNWFQQLPGRILLYFTTIYNNATNKFNQIKNSLVTISRNLVNGVNTSISNLSGVFTNIWNKIINYLDSVKTSLYNKAKNMATNFWNGFKEGLGMSSPSYIEVAFMNIGQQALETVRGINKLVPQVKKDMFSLSKPILATTNGTMMAQPMPTVQPYGAGTMNPMNNNEQTFQPTPIIVQNMNVTSQDDINRLAQELYKLQMGRNRGKGIRDTI